MSHHCSIKAQPVTRRPLPPLVAGGLDEPVQGTHQTVTLPPHGVSVKLPLAVPVVIDTATRRHPVRQLQRLLGRAEGTRQIFFYSRRMPLRSQD